MTVLLSGASPLLITAGTALQVGTSAGSGGQNNAAPALSTVTGLSGWWDAGVAPAGGWGSTPSSLPDLSGSGHAASLSNATANPRLAGLLGGMCLINQPSNYTVQHPYLSSSFNFSATVPVASGALSIYFVWSRPGFYSGNAQPAPQTVPLLSIGGTTVLQMTGTGSGDTLIFMPSGANISAGSVELRHTHSARVIISTAGIDVWLDGTKIISAATNTLSLGSTATFSLLAGAQCFFHEAGTWARALSTSDQTQLTLCMARWPSGPRFGGNVILTGQSNANYEYGNAFPMMQRLIAYWSGRMSCNVLVTAINASSGGGNSIWSGCALYAGSGDTTDTLANSGNGNPATWAYGTNGTQFATMASALSADLLANVSALAWFWSESDSTRAYSEKATFVAAVKRCWSLMRASLGKSAAQLPVLVISALPFTGSDGGCEMVRQAMADLIADSTQNAHWMLTQSCDAIGLGDSWSNTTGLESGGGNGAHRDATGNTTFGIRMAMAIAQVIAANSAGTQDVVTAFPSGLTALGGPQIASAHYEGTTYAATGTVLVTVTHSNGATGLLAPLQAANGAGWTIMDGGSPAAPGTLVTCSACAVLSATTFRLTLAHTLSNPSTATIYYPYGQALTSPGYAVIGQGNAVTDNFSTVTLPAGWQIGADLGAAYQPNFPVQTPPYGVAFS